MTTKKEKPIIFSAPMVRAILSGKKTQTRRIVKPCKDRDIGCELACCELAGEVNSGDYRNAPWNPGERLWVRESFMHFPADYCWEASTSIPSRPEETVYRADFADANGVGWKPSIHMPRTLSRILLEITDVRVERLCEISEKDAIAEGVERTVTDDGWRHYHADEEMEACGLYPMPDARRSFLTLWNSLHGHGAWTENPWVWVICFKRVEKCQQ